MRSSSAKALSETVLVPKFLCPPTNHRSFYGPAGFSVLPYAIAKSAQKRDHISTIVILAEYLKCPVSRWAALVNEIVNALLPRYQFRSLARWANACLSLLDSQLQRDFRQAYGLTPIGSAH